MTRTRALTVTVGTLLVLLPSAAVSWTPVDCTSKAAEVDRLYQEFWDTSRRQQWDEYLREVATAEKGGRLYAPEPFPKTQKDVLKNLRYAYFEILFDDPKSVPEEELPIYEGLVSSAFELRMVRVENWGTSRCLSFRPIPYYDLVRVYDMHGQELARFAMHYTGLLARYAHVTSIGREQLPEIASVIQESVEALNLESAPEAGKYVVVDGLPVHCGPMMPCVALKKSRNMTYIWDRGQAIYSINKESPRMTVSARREEAIRTRKLDALGAEISAESVWMTVGFEWVRARRVWPQP